MGAFGTVLVVGRYCSCSTVDAVVDYSCTGWSRDLARFAEFRLQILPNQMNFIKNEFGTGCFNEEVAL